MSNISLPAPARGRTVHDFGPRDLFLVEVLLAVLAAVAVALAGAWDDELLLHLLSSGPWMR